MSNSIYLIYYQLSYKHCIILDNTNILFMDIRKSTRFMRSYYELHLGKRSRQILQKISVTPHIHYPSNLSPYIPLLAALRFIWQCHLQTPCIQERFQKAFLKRLVSMKMHHRYFLLSSSARSQNHSYPSCFLTVHYFSFLNTIILFQHTEHIALNH